MKIVKYLDLYFEEILIACLLGIMVLMCGLQVVFRYFLNSSLAWTEELARYCYVWSGFLTIGYCIRHKSTLKLEFLVNFLPKKLSRALNYLIYGFCIVVFCIFLRGAIQNVQTTIQVQQKSTALELPMQFVFSSGIVGFSLGILRSVEMIIFDILGIREEKETPPDEEVVPIDFTSSNTKEEK